MYRHTTRGFTLIELMVAMALMLILIIMIASFVANAQRIYNRSVAQAQVMSNARMGLQIMGRDLSAIHSTLSTAGMVIPSEPDENFTPAEHEAAAALVMRSLGYVDEEDWTDIQGINESNWPGYSDIDPIAAPAPEDNARDDAFLQFFATTRYFNPYPDVGDPRFENQPVLVQYYLRQRPEEDGYFMPGSYLMRRIQPFDIQVDSSGAPQWNGWATPIEDDICGFIRGVRVYYYDRDREVDESNEDMRFIEAISPTTTDATTVPPPSDDPTLDPDVRNRTHSMWDPALGAITFWIPNDWSSWLDPGFAANSPAFDKKMFLPPSIKVRLLVTSSDGNTYREVQEIFPLPAAPDRIPINPYQ